MQENLETWHKRLGHTNYRNMHKLISNDAVRGLPKLEVKEKLRGDCQVGKQTQVSHQQFSQVTASRVLDLLHMDLMGLVQVERIGGKKYIYVCVDDYSRYTWVEVLREKSDAFAPFKQLATQIQREQETHIIRIRSDHDKEFENAKLDEYCSQEGIKHEFSAPITPQQNDIVERKNRIIQEMARVMLHSKKMPIKFWGEAVNTACHIHNRITLRPGTNNTTYEIWRGRKPNVQYFHIFGSVCYILADREPRHKFDVKGEKWIFLGYSRNYRALRVYNKRTQVIMESIKVKVVDEEAEHTETEPEEPVTPTVIDSGRIP
ncbi:hypothetical protein LIER_19856 [Lithospermum erythrorhizon]|uniref:Integrase catalytic domain-containing protein n=1 Tax=Lithospermum erythrorhizon TaxID=34254 RepID=A0AAV3QMC2_LITER